MAEAIEENSDQATYIEPVSGQQYSLNAPRWCSDAGLPLLLTSLPGITRAAIDRGKRSLWRYAKAFPLPIPDPITMGEGCTPLVRRAWGAGTPFFKIEWLSPTGSFKDRGASVMLSLLRAQGIGHVLEDSSGNGGAAIAAYAAAGGMRAKILAPASTQPAKTVQMRACGAEVELVPGSRQDTADEAERQAKGIFYASHNWHPFFLHGTKTLAYELWEDLGFAVPDNIIAPTGAGSNILGCDIGFDELMRVGEISHKPRLFAAQPANCAPIHAAFMAADDVPPHLDIRPTIAEGTAIAKPIRLTAVVDAVRRSGGCTVAVSEQEIIDAVNDLARVGLYAEPTSAAAAAAFSQLLVSGTIKPDQVTVVLLTGSGLKSTQRIAEILRA